MQFSEYQSRYKTIHMTRNEGILEVRIHTRGGSALWGTSLQSLHNELGLAFGDIASDAENKVVILTGTGDSFIAGMDDQERAHEPSLAIMWKRIYREGIDLLEKLLAIPVPVIAAVNGPALIHAELAALSDIVLAAEHTEFADLAHVPGGTVPGDGVHTVWPMLLGPNRGRYFLLTGERIGAQEAKRLGVVAEVLPSDQLLPRAEVLAKQLAALPAEMLRHTRRLMVRHIRKRIQEELDVGLALEALAMLSD